MLQPGEEKEALAGDRVVIRSSGCKRAASFSGARRTGRHSESRGEGRARRQVCSHKLFQSGFPYVEALGALEELHPQPSLTMVATHTGGDRRGNIREKIIVNVSKQ